MLKYLRTRRGEAAIYLLLALINLILGCYLIAATPYPSEGDGYGDIARALVGKGGTLYNQRPNWGYPILLILTGYPWTNRPLIPELVQVAMASAIPYLIGATLRELGVGFGIRMTAAVVSFLAFPTVFALSLLTNTYGEFLLYLTVFLLAWSLVRADAVALSVYARIPWRAAAIVGLAFFELYLARSENLLLGFAVLFLALLLTANAARALLWRAIAVFAVLAIAWIPMQKGWTAWMISQHHTPVFAGTLPSFLFFKNIYSGGSSMIGRPATRPENGPCSALIFATVQRNLTEVDRFRQGQTPATMNELFAVRSIMNANAMWQSVLHDFDEDTTARMFWCAGMEAIYAEPKALLYYYDGLIAFFLYDDLIYDYGFRQAWLSASDYTPVNVPFWAWSMYVGAAIKVVALSIAFATLIPTWRRGGYPRVLAVVLWTAILLTAGNYVALAAPHWRYTEPVIPGLVLLAGLGLSSLKHPQSAAVPTNRSLVIDG
jgi:hypothetical protein